MLMLVEFSPLRSRIYPKAPEKAQEVAGLRKSIRIIVEP
jgi:hypothetical protein